MTLLLVGFSAAVSPAQKKPDRARHVLEVLQIKEGHVVADIGCGSGWLSEAVAKAVGPKGKVYAVDINKKSILAVEKRGIPNMIPVHSVPDDVLLPEDSLDIAFLHDVACHVAKNARKAFYASIAKALKPGGSLIIFGHHGGAKKHLKEMRQYGFDPETPEALAGLTDKELNAKHKSGIRFSYRASEPADTLQIKREIIQEIRRLLQAHRREILEAIEEALDDALEP